MKPPPRPAVGRPAKYCDEVHARIVAAAALGAFRRMQAQAGGVSLSCLDAWLTDARNDPEGSPYGQLLGDIEKAESDTVNQCLGVVLSGDPQWQSRAWWLERKFPSEYGRRVTELHGKDGAPLEFHVVWPSTLKREG